MSRLLLLGQVVDLCSQCEEYAGFTVDQVETRLMAAIERDKALIWWMRDRPQIFAMVTWAMIEPALLQRFFDGTPAINADFDQDHGIGVVCNLIAPYGGFYKFARIFQRYLADRYGEGRTFHWRRGWKGGKLGHAVSRKGRHELVA